MKVKKSMVGVTVIVVLAIMVNSVIIGRNKYNEEDVKHYLKDTGIPIYTNIGKDELHSIVNYNQTIYFKQ